MIINLPEFDFERPDPITMAIAPLLNKVREFLDTKEVKRNGYSLGSELTAGFGELVIKEKNGFWLVYTTERGTNFDVAIFSNEFHAVNYFIFRLTGETETIDWSAI
ncbi:hypothetical protein [Massilia sp. HP4]|uniref:hypothetical protein n=1 Tax=Massilia sp. HP4 TaxID=2562316 RepID=UPI0010BFB672|nr:hypothetical protein [Massilia sp. HP4]